jgi:uncharacterized RDD family membrane protein YckC
MPNPSAGTKAGLFRRWFATAIDPLIGFLLWFAIVLGVGRALGTIEQGIFGSMGVTVFAIIAVTGIYGGYYLKMLSKGTTPGKWLLCMQVTNKEDGGYPGLGRMFLREIVGKFVSGLFLGIGYFWAIFDNDGQAWHDKIAGTVVVKKGALASVTLPLATSAPRFVMATVAAAPSRPATERFCSNCGGKNPMTSNFCGHCGGRL